MASGAVRVSTGAVGDFAALARDLQRAGAGGLRKELYKGLSRAARPLPAAIVANAQSTLPSGGGRGRRRTRLVSTGQTLTNAASGRTHKVKQRRRISGALASGESVADRVAGARFQVRMAGGASGPRVRITATERRGKKIDLYALNDGRLRHPLFGNRRHWSEQAVTPGWFTKPIEGRRGEFLKELQAAVDAVAREIEGG